MRSFLAWFWTLVIFAACWTPKQMMPEEPDTGQTLLVPNFDKLVHFGLFCGFAYLWMATRSIRVRTVIAAGLFVTALSELGQLIPAVNRDANLADATADMLGVGAGLVGFAAVAFLRTWTRKASLTIHPDQIESTL